MFENNAVSNFETHFQLTVVLNTHCLYWLNRYRPYLVFTTQHNKDNEASRSELSYERITVTASLLLKAGS